MNKLPSVAVANRKPVKRARFSDRLRGLSLLTQMFMVALAVHLVVFTVFSVGGYLPHEQTPEELYDKGVAAMSSGKYAEARDLFQKVLDQQPKPAPVFERAAEQHRNAERLASQSEATTVPTTPTAPDLAAPAPAGPASITVIPRPADGAGSAPQKPAGSQKGTPPASPDEIIPPELK